MEKLSLRCNDSQYYRTLGLTVFAAEVTACEAERERSRDAHRRLSPVRMAPDSGNAAVSSSINSSESLSYAANDSSHCNS